MQTFQSADNHIPVRRVYHHGHGGDVGFRSDHIQESNHLLTRIQQAVIHIDIDDQCAVSHLFTGYRDGFFILVVLDESEEFPRASHITSFTHIHEVDIRSDIEHLQSAKPHRRRLFHRLVRLLAIHQCRIFRNKAIVRTTASANDVHQPLVNHLSHLGCHALRSLVVESHRVRQTGIRIGGDIIRRLPGQLAQEGYHLTGTKRAVQSQTEYRITAHAGQKSIQRLSTQCSASQVAHRDADHQGQRLAMLRHGLHRRIDGHLCIQRIENRFYQQGIHPTLYQRVSLFVVGLIQLVVAHVAQSGIAHVRRHRTGLIRRPYRTCHKTRFVCCSEFVGTPTGYPRPFL